MGSTQAPPTAAPAATGPIPAFKDENGIGLEDVPSFDHLPPRASWESGLPVIRDQYDDKSCGSWASAYYAMTAMTVYEQLGLKPSAPDDEEARHLVRDSDVRGGHVFSPSFVFNRLMSSGAWTPSAASALAHLQARGAVKWYWHKVYVGQPDPPEKPFVTKAALRHRVRDFGLIDVRKDPIWKEKVKWWLANRSPVLFDIHVLESFFEHKPKKSPILEVSGPYLDTHVIACVGYDDSESGGCFRFANTWGTGWGDKGLAWVRHDAARALVGAGQRAWGFRLL